MRRPRIYRTNSLAPESQEHRQAQRGPLQAAALREAEALLQAQAQAQAPERVRAQAQHRAEVRPVPERRDPAEEAVGATVPALTRTMRT